ncbi:hypothetical protein M2263_004623 [Providencia alcalifaciens]|nr:hypothetical protein [Providencia alcalifaciens]
MNNEKLIDSTLNELTYAASILNIIINNPIEADQDVFTVIESVVENIDRAKNNVGGIKIDSAINTIGEVKLTESETIETAIGSVLSVLQTAINLKVAEESGKLKAQDTPIINLIASAKLNLEAIYTKVSFTGAQ